MGLGCIILEIHLGTLRNTVTTKAVARLSRGLLCPKHCGTYCGDSYFGVKYIGYGSRPVRVEKGGRAPSGRGGSSVVLGMDLSRSVGAWILRRRFWGIYHSIADRIQQILKSADVEFRVFGLCTRSMLHLEYFRCSFRT